MVKLTPEIGYSRERLAQTPPAMAAHTQEGTALPATVLGLAASCEISNVRSAARVLTARAAHREGGYVCLCNVHVLTLALRDEELHRALSAAWRRLPDGEPVAWLQRRMGSPGARRVGGPDLMPAVFDSGRELGIRHFLLGSTPDVLTRLSRALEQRFPGAEIVGLHSPPFSDDDPVDVEAIELIRAAQPSIVWCALGAPKQEIWMHNASSALPDVLLVGIGAAFDFLAGSKPRAPRWMQAGGLEWFHRLVTEPRRLAGRYLSTNTEFLVRCAVELFYRRRGA